MGLVSTFRIHRKNSMSAYEPIFNSGSVVRSRHNRVGFTLIDLMITITILGIIAVEVIPTFKNAQVTASATSAGTSMVAIAKAARHYKVINGEWPEDKNRRVIPPELMQYFPYIDFENAPLGGVWDYEDWRGQSYTAGGDLIGIAVSIVEGDPSQYIHVDRAIDDGDLESGSVRFCESKPRLIYILTYE